MSNSERVSGYKIGKEYGTVTPIRLVAWLCFSVAGTTFLFDFLLHNSTHVPSANTPIGVRLVSYLAAALFVVGGVLLESIHKKLPCAKYTVLNTYQDCDGYYKANLRYSDGTETTRNLGVAHGAFWPNVAHLLLPKGK